MDRRTRAEEVARLAHLGAIAVAAKLALPSASRDAASLLEKLDFDSAAPEVGNAIQRCVADGMDRLIEAANLLVRARDKFDAVAPAISWRVFIKEHCRIGERQARTLLRVGRSDNPRIALLEHRRKNREANQRYRERSAEPQGEHGSGAGEVAQIIYDAELEELPPETVIVREPAEEKHIDLVIEGESSESVFAPKPDGVTIEQLHRLWTAFGEAYAAASPMVRQLFKEERQEFDLS